MTVLWSALAVVPRDEGDDLDLGVGESHEAFAVTDDVVTVQVMLAVRDEQTDVGEKRGRLEVLAAPFVELVEGGRGVEKRQRQPGDLRGVLRFLVAKGGELGHASATHVAE